MTESSYDLQQIIWQEVYWPHPLLPEHTAGLLTRWAAQVHAPQIILEARASRRGIRYLVGTQARHLPQVRRDIEMMVPQAIVATSESDRLPVSATKRLSLSRASQPLRSGELATSLRTILASLVGVRGDEQIVTQLILGPRLVPTLTPSRAPKFDQSLASRLTRGIELETRSDVLRRSADKAGSYGFRALVRVGISAGNEARQRTLLNGVVSAFRTLDAPGLHLIAKPARLQTFNDPREQWCWLAPSEHLSVPEVQVLTAWPITDSVAPYPGQAAPHPRQVRPSFVMPKHGRQVAVSTAPGTAGVPLGLSELDSTRHLWSLGPTGVGKSSMLLSLIIQDMQAGRPIVVVEPKDLIDDLLRHVPESRRDDVVLIDPLDSAPVGFNPLDSGGRPPHLVADQLLGLFKSLYGEGLGPRSSDILSQSLQALAQCPAATLAMVPMLLQNPAFRAQVVQPAVAADPVSAAPFWHWFNHLSAEQSAQITAPLMNKLRPLLDPYLRRVIAQGEPRFNVRQVLNERKILLVPLRKGVVGPEAAQLLGALMVAELWNALQERAAIPAHNRRPVMVYLDEVQEYLRLPTDLGEALAMSRSLGAAFHVAHQFLDQLSPSMRSAFEANCRSRVFFQLSARDAKAAAAMAPGLEPEDYMSLPARGVYVQLVKDGAVTDWASGATLDLPATSSQPAGVRKLSRESYGRPIADIEQAFLDVLRTTTEATSTSTTKRRRRS